MGKRHLPPRQCCKVFCAIIVTVKRSASEEIFMHYFYDLSIGFWELRPRVPDPYRGSIPGPRWGTFVPKPLICPPLEKNPPGAHGNGWLPKYDEFFFVHRYICGKLFIDAFSSFIRKVANSRQTDRQTDRRTKNEQTDERRAYCITSLKGMN